MIVDAESSVNAGEFWAGFDMVLSEIPTDPGPDWKSVEELREHYGCNRATVDRLVKAAVAAGTRQGPYTDCALYPREGPRFRGRAKTTARRASPGQAPYVDAAARAGPVCSRRLCCP